MFKEQPFNEYKEKIMNFLKEHNNSGYSLSELSRNLNIPLRYITTTVYLLKDNGKVYTENYGHVIVVKIKEEQK
jgi:DNA-binding IscR family transcriptional regulator